MELLYVEDMKIFALAETAAHGRCCFYELSTLTCFSQVARELVIGILCNTRFCNTRFCNTRLDS
jgi:hypothetical protein